MIVSWLLRSIKLDTQFIDLICLQAEILCLFHWILSKAQNESFFGRKAKEFVIKLWFEISPTLLFLWQSTENNEE